MSGPNYAGERGAPGTPGKPNPNAQALGKLAAGRPKKYTPEELAKRTSRLPRRTKKSK